MTKRMTLLSELIEEAKQVESYNQYEARMEAERIEADRTSGIGEYDAVDDYENGIAKRKLKVLSALLTDSELIWLRKFLNVLNDEATTELNTAVEPGFRELLANDEMRHVYETDMARFKWTWRLIARLGWSTSDQPERRGTRRAGGVD